MKLQPRLGKTPRKNIFQKQSMMRLRSKILAKRTMCEKVPEKMEMRRSLSRSYLIKHIHVQILFAELKDTLVKDTAVLYSVKSGFPAHIIIMIFDKHHKHHMPQLKLLTRAQGAMRPGSS